MDADTMLRSVYNELHDRDKRKRNIIVSGLKPDSTFNDVTLFTRLCCDHLDFNVAAYLDPKQCRRLKSVRAIQPLLITLTSEAAADELLHLAKKLRDANDAVVRESIFLNADLTPTDAKLAFEAREKRRNHLKMKLQSQPTGQASQSTVIPSTSSMDISYPPPQQDTTSKFTYTGNRFSVLGADNNSGRTTPTAGASSSD
jgi:hypothetical protein